MLPYQKNISDSPKIMQDESWSDAGNETENTTLWERRDDNQQHGCHLDSKC